MTKDDGHGLRRVDDLISGHASALEVGVEARWCPVHRSVMESCHDLSTPIYWAAWGIGDDGRLWDFMWGR